MAIEETDAALIKGVMRRGAAAACRRYHRLHSNARGARSVRRRSTSCGQPLETDRLPDGWCRPLRAVRRSLGHRTAELPGLSPERRGSPSALASCRSCYDEGARPARWSPDFPCHRECSDGKFVFLSVFDWQLRKGWDLLIFARTARSSPSGEGVALAHILPRPTDTRCRLCGHRQNEVLTEFGQVAGLPAGHRGVGSVAKCPRHGVAVPQRFSLRVRRPRPRLGRPYLEAMACGLPTIGTPWLGSADFMTDEQSFLVDASLVSFPHRL